MKIILNTDSLIMGGAEKLALVYTKRLNKEYEVELLINEDNGLEENELINEIPKDMKIRFLINYLEMKKINKYRKLKKKNKLYKLHYNFALKKRKKIRNEALINALKNKEKKIVIDFACKLPLKVTNSNTIVWLHMTLSAIERNKKKWYREKFKKAGKIIVITDAMKNEFENLFPEFKEKLVKIYNPFDFKGVVDLSNDNSTLTLKEQKMLEENFILSCSRLDEKQKDVKSLIESYNNLIKEKKIKEKLYIIGDGRDKLTLENLVKKHKLENNVKFLGFQNNPYIWMKNSKAFVHSSKKEGFGMVLVEAMICGAIVIATDCPVGPKEILESGRAGYLCEVGNIEEIGNSIVAALEDSSENNQKRKIATKKIEEFEIEKSIEILNRVIKEMSVKNIAI